MAREHLAVVPAVFGNAGEVEKCGKWHAFRRHGHFLGPARDSKPHVVRSAVSPRSGLMPAFGMISFHVAMSRP